MSRINDMSKDGEVYVKFDDSSAWQKMGAPHQTRVDRAHTDNAGQDVDHPAP